MNLWSGREEALRALEGSLVREAALLADLFAVFDACSTKLMEVGTPFARVSSLYVAKIRNLALASYSLSLDSLAQESGALLRPMLECSNLVIYVRDPANLERVLDQRPPSAGDVAAAISATNRNLRNYLSANASHFASTWESLRHIVDVKAGTVRTVQPFREPVLRTNLRTLALFMVQLSVEAILNLDLTGADVRPIASEADECRQRALAMPP